MTGNISEKDFHELSFDSHLLCSSYSNVAFF